MLLISADLKVRLGKAHVRQLACGGDQAGQTEPLRGLAVADPFLERLRVGNEVNNEAVASTSGVENGG